MLRGLWFVKMFYSQWFTPSRGSNVLPGVLEVELPLLVPELGVGESVKVRVAQASEESPGVVPRGQEVSVGAAFLLGQSLALPHHLRAQTSDTVSPG